MDNVSIMMSRSGRALGIERRVGEEVADVPRAEALALERLGKCTLKPLRKPAAPEKVTAKP